MKTTEQKQESALICLEAERNGLLSQRQKQLDLFVNAASGGHRRKLAQVFEKIRQTNEFLHTLAEIETSLSVAQQNMTSRRYIISSLFLYDSYKKLTADRYEQFFFVTGSELNGALFLDQWAEFEHQKRTESGVTGDTRATHRALIRLEQFGHHLLAHFHSHPGNGPGMTQPSGIDLNFQTRLEAAGHRALMAIFSRDGFVRFIRLDGTPEIEIYGTGVEKHDDENSIYRLTEIYNA